MYEPVEDIMVRTEPGIIVAAAAIFVALAGIGAIIRGLLFDSSGFIRYGAIALVVGVACFVVLLNSTTRNDN